MALIKWKDQTLPFSRGGREQFDKKTWQGPATFEEAIIYWTPMQIFATVSPFVSQATYELNEQAIKSID